MSRAPVRKGWECVLHGGDYPRRGACPECKKEETAGAAGGIDRALKKNADSASYEADALSIARVMSRHYGDEAAHVLKMTIDKLEDERKAKR